MLFEKIAEKVIIGTVSSILGTVILSKVVENKMQDYDTEIFRPMDRVSIIMPVLNEEQFILQSLTSIRYQTIIQRFPEFFELILVDSGSIDNTVNLARPFVDKVIQTEKRGKLTARNMATDEARGNIVVSVDGDCIYPIFWLNTLLEPFNNVYSPDYDPKVVGVNGSTIDYSIPGLSGNTRSLLEVWEWAKSPNKLLGRNSVYFKHAFYQIGRFNENINQTDVGEMVKEEEYDFGTRLSKLGKIVQKHNASCIHLGGSRIGCRLGTESKEICKEYGIGIHRFG